MFLQTRNPEEFLKCAGIFAPESAYRLKHLRMPFRDAFMSKTAEPWAVTMSKVWRNLEVLTLLMSDDPVDKIYNCAANRALQSKKITKYLQGKYEKNGNTTRPTVHVELVRAMEAEEMGIGVLTWMV